MVSSFPLILTQSNRVDNSTYTYNFPYSVDLSNFEVALANCSLYYSWFSISGQLNNNTFSFDFPSAATNTTYTVTIPDGTYQIDQLQNYLEYFMYNNGLYISNNTTGEITYYIKLLANETAYKIQLISYPLQTSLPAGFTNGGGIVFPTVSRQPQLIVPATNFVDLIGFSAGTYPSAQNASIYTQNGDLIPQISGGIQSIILNCNVVNNKYSSSNSQSIHVMTSAGVEFGSLVVSEPAEYNFVQCGVSSTSNITITFMDNYNRPLQINDPNLTIKLLLREKELV
jgi:hypothetical protein